MGGGAPPSAHPPLPFSLGVIMLIGVGLYTPNEAAALLHEQLRTVRRWAFGYRRNRASGTILHQPLIKTDLPIVDGERALTFVEVIELLYIRAFERAGASWAIIKEAARVAAKLYSSDHPFALRQLYIDPGSLYGAALEADGSESLIQLAGHGQHAFPELVKPYLEQLSFGLNDVADRWWPMGRIGGVVIDPRFSFGAPIVEEVGIRTRVLSDAYQAEAPTHRDRTLEHVAWMYEIHPRHVQTALMFRRWLMTPDEAQAA